MTAAKEFVFRGPAVLVPWVMRDDPIWGNDRALARWLREAIEEGRAKRRHRRAYISDRIWLPILAAFGYRCAYCGSEGPLERDHRVPVRRGGTDDPSNLVPACKPCNVRKGAAHPDDWPLLVEPRWSS